MFAFIINSLIGGVLSPITSFLAKKQDVTLEEYKSLTAAERDEYASYIAGLRGSNEAKVQAGGWWGAHLMIYLFGIPAVLHWGAVFLVSTFPTWLPYVIPALPAAYANAEQTIALSFFILAPAMPIVTSVARMLNRK